MPPSDILVRPQVLGGFGGGIPGGWTTEKILRSNARIENEVGFRDLPAYYDINLASDLMDRWPIREQGMNRGTCNAFAAVAAEELAIYRDDPGQGLQPLSEEFLYTLMRRDHPPSFPVADDVTTQSATTGATFLDQAKQVIEEVGLCDRSLMPYNDDRLLPPNHTEDPAPGAMANAAPRKRKMVCNTWKSADASDGPDRWRTNPGNQSISEIFLERLEDGTPVVASFPIFDLSRRGAWTNRTAEDRGRVSYRGQIDREPVAGHTICIVGCTTKPDLDQGGMFLFRNSHGKRFASQNKGSTRIPAGSLGVGYGMISARDVDRFCWDYLYRDAA